MPTEPIQIRPGEAGRLIVQLPYSPDHVAKIKTVAGRRWHPKEKCWTLPHTNGALAHLLALFAGEPIEVDPSLRPASRTHGVALRVLPWTVRLFRETIHASNRYAWPSAPDISAATPSKRTATGSSAS